MNDVYIGIGVMIIIYLLYFVLIISNKRRLSKYISNSKETNLIKARYKIDFNKVNHKLVANLFAINNSIIIGITYMLIMLINNFLVKLLIAFIVFIVLLVVSYMQIGKYIKRREVK